MRNRAVLLADAAKLPYAKHVVSNCAAETTRVSMCRLPLHARPCLHHSKQLEHLVPFCRLLAGRHYHGKREPRMELTD